MTTKIVVQSREEAELVIEHLGKIIDQYGVARISDLHDLVGLPNVYSNNLWGWSSTKGVSVFPVENGYSIKLPLAKTIREAKMDFTVTENTSDGFHTFKELYEHRVLYNAALFNEWTMLDGNPFKVHKSVMHSDGTFCFDGTWFIVMAQLPTGQISNHYKLSDWKLFMCESRYKAEVWDGHTSEDVLKRLREFLS